MGQLRPTQQCPICGAMRPLSARKCTICGAVLRGKPTPAASLPPVPERDPQRARPRFDPAQGDDDHLYTGDLTGRMWRVLLVVGIGAALVIGVGVGVGLAGIGGKDKPGSGLHVEVLGTESPTAPPTATPRPSAASPAPTLGFATVTPAPPLPTDLPAPTETPPCIQTAQAGDTVFGMAIRCGHQHMDVVDLILEMNGLKNAADLQQGQTLQIPWPTPTPGGEPTQILAPDGGASAETPGTPEAHLNEFATPDALAVYQNIEPTLRPGMAWHVVQPDETILGIAWEYDTTLETLSQINPEIPFNQCDYSSPSGGPNCIVMLAVGDRVRVPVPLPTQTSTPAPEGTLTPTPTATATFNAPFLLSPKEGAVFFADQSITLRWGGTGTLAPEEWYLVRVRDLDTGEEFLAPVRDVMYVLPGGWQPADGRQHRLEWTIAVARLDAQHNILSEDHQTEPRPFAWDSR